MNTITTEQSINNQSFFKLPLIFMTVFFIIYFIAINSIDIFMQDIPITFVLQNTIYSLLSQLLPLFLFFVTAVFCCQKYRLYSVTDSWMKVSLIAIIFALLCVGWSCVIFKLFEGMIIADTMLVMTSYYLFSEIIFYILFTFILIFLFHLFAKKGIDKRTMFKLENVTGSRVYSHIYSFLMLFLSIVTISFSFNCIVDVINFYDYDIDMSVMMFILLLCILISFFIYYVSCYFATRNYFKRIEPTVKLGRLILTVLVTYLFLFSSNLTFVCVIIMFAVQYIAIMLYYVDEGSIQTLILTLFFIYNVINLLLLFVFSRLAVKIMYS